MQHRTVQLIIITAVTAALSTAGLLARLSWSNLDLVILDNLTRPFLVIWLATLLIAGVAFWFSRRIFALVPALVFLLFCYGAAAEIDAWLVSSTVFAAAAVLTTFALIHHFTRQASPNQVAWGSLAIFAAMTVPFAAPMHGLFSGTGKTNLSPQFSGYVANISAQPLNDSQMPDVIYIIPDRYGSARTLQHSYGTDNSAFYADLRKRGFIVNPDALANYPTTAHSLASTTNSAYLEPLKARFGGQTGRLQPLYDAFENSHAQQAMRKLGYRFINAGSWWDASRVNRNASANLGTNPLDGMNRVSLSEIEQTLWKATPLRDLPGFSSVSAGRTECVHIKQKLDLLGQAGNVDEPVFIQAHMTIPHTPIVADQDGNCLPTSIDYPMDGVTWQAFKAAYADYLHYFNTAKDL